MKSKLARPHVGRDWHRRASGLIAPREYGFRAQRRTGMSSAALPDIVHTDHGDDSDGANQTVYDFGPFTTTRSKAIAFIGGWDLGPGLAASSVVADPSGSANSFTFLKSAGTIGTSSVLHRLEIWGYNGTLSSDTIRVTWSESIYRSAITIISLDEVVSLSPEDNQSTDLPGGTSLEYSSLSAVSAGGVALCCASTQANNANSWSGFSGTELSDFDLEIIHFSAWISDPSYDGSTITVSASGDLELGVGVTLR